MKKVLVTGVLGYIGQHCAVELLKNGYAVRGSGSSVRGRSRISKIGNRKLRNLLFLCSFTACKHKTRVVEIFMSGS